MSESLECFVCSELDSIPCPDDNSDYASWKSEAQKYVSHDPSSSNDGLSCSIIIGGETLNEKYRPGLNRQAGYKPMAWFKSP